MTTSSDTLPKTEKYPHEKLTLDGSNYSQWATGFKMWAGGLGLWPYISGDEKEPSPPAQLTDPDQNILRKEKHDECVRLYKQRRLLALSALSTAIDAQDFVYLCDTEDPNIGWEALAGKYLPQKAIHFNQYLDRLSTIPKAHDSTSIAEVLQSLVVLKSDLTALSISPPAAAAAATAITLHTPPGTSLASSQSNHAQLHPPAPIPGALQHPPCSSSSHADPSHCHRSQEVIHESVDPPSSKTHADPSRFLPFAVHESVDPPLSSSHADPSHFPLFTVLHEYMGHELLPAAGYIPS
ncbi:uncharacterized protein F5147DRAFT_781626 [Suillus discolor]|uniref:Retrotransposon Copia-like N-terminal domain-containing protein n=1 Tax=Suillus discolor TaxID=1912936 RepID=A0A9P7ESZ4_9AGAM|nr:uncharacterized protein F5147DRAFT_781626 [Suillus discolor]KAG2086456.1 hypothetical protein F5147DRAFT_781626 [Suillus discolor]